MQSSPSLNIYAHTSIYVYIGVCVCVYRFVIVIANLKIGRYEFHREKSRVQLKSTQFCVDFGLPPPSPTP